MEQLKRPVGRPPASETTCRLTIRIPASVYEAFKQRSERLGFASAIEPIKRWIRNQACPGVASGDGGRDRRE